MLELVLEFFRSLGVIGYVVLTVLVLALLNIKKLILLRSPLDSQQHRNWRATGGTTNPDHLENTVAPPWPMHLTSPEKTSVRRTMAELKARTG